MRKGNTGRLLFCFLFLLLICAGCKNDKEKELGEIENKGGSAELRTQYSKDDIVKKYTIEVYTEQRIREEKYFDEEGNRNGYAVFEYDDKKLLIKCSVYDEKGKMTYSSEYKYEYDENGNVVTEYSNNGDIEHINRYKYDDQNRKIYKAEDVAKGIHQEVFYTTSYLYDEEGRLSREEIFATGKPYAYIDYEYDDLMLVKEDKYRVGDNNDSYWEGHEYEYDEKGRVVKCIDYDKLHNCTGYTIYEYR